MARTYEDRELVTFDDCCAENGTDKALHINIENEMVWVPRSVIQTEHPENEVAYIGDTGALVLPKWFAEKEGLA